MDKNKENELLVDIVLNKGNVDKVRFAGAAEKKELISNSDFSQNYGNAKKHAYLSSVSITNDLREIQEYLLQSELKNIEDLARKMLEKRNVHVPFSLNNEEKIAAVAGKLKDDFGMTDEDISELLKSGLGKAETSGQKIVIDLNDTENVRTILDNNNIVYQRDKGLLKVDAKIFAKEGVEVENTAKNKKILDENDVLYAQKAEDERKLFVPLQGKKTALLVASSLIAGPVPAYAIQVILNQTGMLDRLLDQHLISYKQKEALDKGLTVKAMQKVNGKDVEQYLTRDLDTGNVVRVNVCDVQIPSKIHGVDLSPSQMENLRNGKLVDIVSKDGVDMAIRINLNEPGGVQSFYKELKADKDYMQVPKPGSPDVDKLNYIHIKGFSGIYDIYGNDINIDRDSFLKKFDLKSDFHQLLEVQSKMKMAEMSGNPSVPLISSVAEKMKDFKEKVFDIILKEERSQSIKI